MEVVRSGRVELLAVTMGHDGTLLAQASGPLRLPALKAEVRSAVGAGDSFVAGMTLALARGAAPEMAFRWGIAAGTAAVLTPGTGLCQWAAAEPISQPITEAIMLGASGTQGYSFVSVGRPN